MFWTLLKAEMHKMFGSFTAGKNAQSKKAKAKKKSSAGMIVLAVILLLYLGIVFAFLFGMIFFGLSAVLTEETKWAYFATAGILAFFLMVLGSVFTAKNQLYESKDNDLLLSMPIPPSYILGTRMVSLLLLNYFFEAVVAVPAAVVYAFTFGFGVVTFILFVLEFLLLGLFSMAIICALAFLIELVTRKMKNKNIVTMIFSLGFLALYMWAYMNMDKVMSYVSVNIGSISSSIQKWVLPAYWLGRSAAETDALSSLAFALFTALPFALVYYILSKSFIKLTTVSSKSAHVKYRERELKVSGARWALVKKEIKYFVSLPVYMMNGGLGLVFTVALAVLAVVKTDVITGIGIPESCVYPIIILVATFPASMNIITASSISLEGKRLWIAKSIPVSSFDILMSKLYAHCLICLPFMLTAGVVLWAGLGMPWYIGFFAPLVPSLFTILIGFIGLLINLKAPKLEWTNEAVPLKQGMAVALTMLSAMGLSILVLVPGIFLTMLAPVLYLAAVSVVLTALILLFYYITKTCTAKAFMSLGE